MCVCMRACNRYTNGLAAASDIEGCAQHHGVLAYPRLDVIDTHVALLCLLLSCARNPLVSRSSSFVLRALFDLVHSCYVSLGRLVGAHAHSHLALRSCAAISNMCTCAPDRKCGGVVWWRVSCRYVQALQAAEISSVCIALNANTPKVTDMG